MVLQNYQKFVVLTSNMIYIVALGVGFKCPHKVHLNTQCPLVRSAAVGRFEGRVRKGHTVIEGESIEKGLLLFQSKYGVRVEGKGGSLNQSAPTALHRPCLVAHALM